MTTPLHPARLSGISGWLRLAERAGARQDYGGTMRLYLLTVYQIGESHRFLVLAESLAEAIRLASEGHEFMIPGDGGVRGNYSFTLNAEILPCRAHAILEMDAGVIGFSPWRPDE